LLDDDAQELPPQPQQPTEAAAAEEEAPQPLSLVTPTSHIVFTPLPEANTTPVRNSNPLAQTVLSTLQNFLLLLLM
jgi:hypothetical protein